MDLVEQIVANLEVEPGQAEKGIGRHSDGDAYDRGQADVEKVRAAVPNLESYMGRALMSGARTGEMIGVGGSRGLDGGSLRRRISQGRRTAAGTHRVGAHPTHGRQ